MTAAFLRALSDSMPDDARSRLLGPLLPLLVDSVVDADSERCRGYVAADAAARIFAPLAMEKRGRHREAELLRSLPEVHGPDAAAAARRAVLTWTPELAAVAWVLRRAAAAADPVDWVEGVVRAVREVGHGDAWDAAARLVLRLATVGRQKVN